MYQFFVEDEQIANDLVIIEGSDVNHIRNVLRMKCGEKVRISSTSGRNIIANMPNSRIMSAYITLRRYVFIILFLLPAPRL